MKLISWDIGINNLAYCLMEVDENKNWEIKDWKVIDLLEDLRENYSCQGLLKNGKECRKKASVYEIYDEKNEKKYYCKTHQKQATEPLQNLGKNKKCAGINKNKKSCQMKAEFAENDIFYCKKHQPPNAKKVINPSNISFFEKSKLIPEKLDQLENILDIDYVVIENQPSIKNPIMKSIQMIVYTYFLIKGIPRINEILLKNATEKLKVYDGPKIESNIKDRHAKNKYLGIQYAKYFLKEKEENLVYLESHKKSDDLADSFLQGLYFITKHQC